MGEHVRLEVSDAVGTIRLDRPKMNALSAQMQDEILAAATEAGERDDVRAVVVWGGERVFAAGVDIKEMADMSYVDMARRAGAMHAAFTAVARIPKPVVAAVNGYALGGGFELALCADLRFAADDAVVGQPEVQLGVMPGAGGTQRLTRIIGKAKAMDLVLTGRMMKVEEAERAGLVARIVPLADLKNEALKTAETIASMSLPTTMLAKESVNRAYETTLAEGIRFERRVFQSIFGTADQKEGMNAFNSKRPPDFKHR
jgi:enoyl-CoA hydratase/carnithine racemase